MANNNDNNTALIKDALLQIKTLKAKLAVAEGKQVEPIAIIGMGCRFPNGADTPEKYWELLQAGTDLITTVPEDRAGLKTHYDTMVDEHGNETPFRGGFVNNAGFFDAQFFGISPREAKALDPHQRLLLEVAWEALESAAIVPQSLLDSLTGVFVGMDGSDFEAVLHSNEIIFEQETFYFMTGVMLSIAAGRISFTLGLNGPCEVIDTACSSSLVTVHQACQSLRSRECDLALAGGVNLILNHEVHNAADELTILAPDARCKTFDAKADGFARGEGCGFVVLKRLSEAKADGDNILGIVRGSMINHDGRSSGLTAPSGPAQQAVIRHALKRANLTPKDIGYIEAHGTGTILGDPIEIGALSEVFAERLQNPLWVGSVKTNMGHLEGASGIAGLIKTVLLLQHGEIPPHLHFETPNPYVDWETAPVQIPTELTPWPSNIPSIAGISAFGMSGTNAHVIIEGASTDEIHELANEDGTHLLVLSAKAAEALPELAQRYGEFLTNHPDTPLNDICYTAAVGRSHFAHRLSLIVPSRAAMQADLLDFAKGTTKPSVQIGYSPSYQAGPRIAFLFTGQGAQYEQMGRTLFESQPLFRQILQQCDEILQPLLGQSLLDVVYPNTDSNSDPANAPISQTQYTQPALFAVEYALAQVWLSWGITPDIVLGHSIGELVAACVAGVFTLEDGLRLAAERGRLMQALPQDGDMVAVMTDESRVKAALAEHSDTVSIAAINGPQSVVISGEREAVQSIVATLAEDDIRTHQLVVSHAFHSPLMEPMLADFAETARQISYAPPKIALVSNVTGQLVSDEVTKPDYWVQHVRQAVRFMDGITALQAQGVTAFVEIGPKPTLVSMGQQCLADTQAELAWLPSLRPNRDDRQQLLTSLGQLYAQGATVDWAKFYEDDTDTSKPRRIVLPTYPFQREFFWPNMTPKKQGGQSLRPLIDTMIRSPLVNETLFETEVSVTNLPFLNDHRLQDIVVSPAASHLSMVLSAAELAFENRACYLADVVFLEPLILPEDQSRQAQIIFTPQQMSEHQTTVNFQLISFDPEQAELQHSIHATGRVVVSEVKQPEALPLSELRSRIVEVIDIEAVYDAEEDLIFGPSFRWGTEGWLYRPDEKEKADYEVEILGKLTLPEAVASIEGYVIHPGLLDACFQPAGAARDRSVSNDLQLPFAIESLHIHQPITGTEWWAYAYPLEDKRWQMYLLNNRGEVVVEIDGFETRTISRSALQAQQWRRDWLYTIDWQAQALAATSTSSDDETEITSPAKPKNMLIFGADDGLGGHLRNQLQAQGHHVILATAGTTPPDLSTIDETPLNQVSLDPTQPSHFQQLLTSLTNDFGLTFDDVIYAWGTDYKNNLDLPTHTLQLCGGVLHLVQALGELVLAPRLWLVTAGSQDIADSMPQLQVPDGLQVQASPISSEGIGQGAAAQGAAAQGALWGLARTITIEYPQFNCTCIDVDHLVEADDTVAGLVVEMMANDKEQQVAYRDGTRYAARLSRWKPEMTRQPGESIQVRLAEYGTVDQLRILPLQRRVPQPKEIEVEVKAAGLNFRDVLNALGLLAEYYAEHLNIHQASDLPLGFEFAGTVVAVGDEVHEFEVGDTVMGLMEGSLASYLTVPAEGLAPIPQGVSFEEAATIPLTYLTTWYGLKTLADLQPGERVLVHAAAGGVGQAAIQIVNAIGGEVFATASEGKRAFLEGQGIKHIMNSRTLDFADEVMQLTENKGVAVVLNSLSNDFVDRSFDVLQQGGRFIELGKLGIWSEEQVAEKRPDARYIPFDIREEIVKDPDRLTQIWRDMVTAFETKEIHPLPHTVFPVQDISAAFRFMQHAKHIGKVVISFTPPEQPELQETGCYLITGGLGALGLEIVEQMVADGARHLVLTGRRGVQDEATQERLDQLEAEGVHIEVVQADVTKSDDVARMIETAQQVAPLRGIIHAAGVLDDGIMAQQSLARYEKVFAPKVAGAWHLHQYSQDIPLDFFITFSSITALLGSPGQSNYSAANAFMDTLIQHRRQQDLPGLSIIWGNWAQVGMAAPLEEQYRARGLHAISPEQGRLMFSRLYNLPLGHITILPIHWQTLSKQLGGDEPSSFYAAFIKPVSVGVAQSNLRPQLEAASDEERREILLSFMQTEVTRVLGLSEPPNPQLEFMDLGMDSLMGVELRNRLQAELGISLTPTVVLNNPSIEALVEYLYNTLFNEDDAPETTEEMIPIQSVDTETSTPSNEIPLVDEDPLDEVPTEDVTPDPAQPDLVPTPAQSITPVNGTAPDLAIKESDGWSPLVPMRTNGSQPPLFCVHPLVGVVFPYFKLAHALGSDQPVFGLQAMGVEMGQQPLASFEKMADCYIEAIQKVQPTGPYYLGGWSLGGWIAYAMACRLEAKGQQVAFLGIIDQSVPFRKMSIFEQVPPSIRLANNAIRDVWPYVRDYRALEEKIDDQAPKSTRAIVGQVSRVLLQHIRASLAYSPLTYSGPLTIFRTTEQAKQHGQDLGWGRLLQSSMTTIDIPGEHMTLLRDPHVSSVAAILKEQLALARARAEDIQK